MTDSTTPLRPF